MKTFLKVMAGVLILVTLLWVLWIKQQKAMFAATTAYIVEAAAGLEDGKHTIKSPQGEITFWKKNGMYYIRKPDK